MAEAGQAGPSKKRKRTGKARAEAKRAAIAANEQAQTRTDTDAVAPQPEVSTELEPEGPVEVEDATPGLDVDAVAGRIPRALKALHPTFKQGRTFEVQRIVKKVKFLRTKEGDKDEIKKFESQLALLSHLPLDHTTSSHLLIKLQKHPEFKHSPLPTSIASLLKSDTGASTSAQSELLGKVENRLCSNKTVSEGVKAVVAWLMGEDGAKLPSGKKPQKVVPNEIEPETRPRPEKNSGIHAAEVSADDEELELDDGLADGAVWESGSISGSDLPSVRRPRIADSDDSDSAVDEESDDEMAVPVQKRSLKAESNAPKASKQTKAAREPVTSSTFLPSLSTGFTLGDSDSDPDLDPDVDGFGLVGNKAVRKNRRGQRARQAIWEQKFGKHAKHVIARQTAEEDAQRAVQALSGRGRGSRGAIGGPGRWGGQPGQVPRPETRDNDYGSGSRGRPAMFVGRGAAHGQSGQTHGDSRPTAPPSGVHPSWEAAKLRKQKEMGAVKPQGTKIVFD